MLRIAKTNSVNPLVLGISKRVKAKQTKPLNDVVLTPSQFNKMLKENTFRTVDGADTYTAKSSKRMSDNHATPEYCIL